MRVRVVAPVLALVIWAVAAIPAFANTPRDTYLALGDSVAFGTSPLLDPRNANNFIGYPAIVAKTLDMEVTNSACPGEATGGFISLTGLDNVCRPYRSAFPLHTTYTGTQLDFAVNFLKRNPETRLVSLGLDANDFFRVFSGAPGPSPWPPTGCYTPDLATYFATCAVQNLETILTAVRAHYKGKLVMVLYYALNYGDPNSVFVSRDLLNKAMITAGKHFQVRFASGFDAFQAAAAPFGGDSCKAGLLIVTSTSPLTCDVHPTPAGRDLLAKAVVEAWEGDEG